MNLRSLFDMHSSRFGLKVGDLVRYKREHTGVSKMSQDHMTGIIVNISKSHLAKGYTVAHVLWDIGKVWNAYEDRLEVVSD